MSESSSPARRICTKCAAYARANADGLCTTCRKQHEWSRLSRAWMDDALCRQFPAELFFPEDDRAQAATYAKAAKEVCGQCPVRAQCLEYALARGENAGVWGGMSPRERAAERRARQAAAAAEETAAHAREVFEAVVQARPVLNAVVAARVEPAPCPDGHLSVLDSLIRTCVCGNRYETVCGVCQVAARRKERRHARLVADLNRRVLASSQTGRAA